MPTPDPPVADKGAPRLPEPIPFRPNDPFVGNLSTDDNVRERIQVALWSATHGNHHGIVHSVDHGRVVLSGTVRDDAERARCEDAVRAVAGVVDLTSELTALGTGAAVAATPQMLFVTRFCQTHTASIDAGIHDALHALRAGGVDLSAIDAEDVLVIYRNCRTETVTIELGVPLAAPGAAAARNGFRLGAAPGGPELTAQLAEDGWAGLLSAAERLRLQAREQGAVPADWFWHWTGGEVEPLVAGLEVHLPLLTAAPR